ILGLAVGVALLFSSQVASTSLNSSVARLSRDLVGQMQWQLEARGPQGFPAGVLRTVRATPGVAEALPVLEEQADVIGPRGRESVELLGSAPQFAHAGGPLLRHFSAEKLERQEALALPAPVAAAIGAQSLLPIEIQVGTRVTSTLLGATLQQADIGDLIDSPVAVAPVAYAEQLAGTKGRVTRIFVRAKAGHEQAVHAALLRLAGSSLNVEPADFDSTLFAKAAAPANQAAELFSAISSLVGFMFAFNAILITTQLRRSLIRELRRHGATRWMTISTLLFDALVLGTLGSAFGLLLGDLVSAGLSHTNPGYLSYAFPVGSGRVVSWQSIALAVGAGLLAAAIGVLTPLRGELSRPLRQTAERDGLRERRSTGWAAIRNATGAACFAATTVILLADPGAAIVGSVALVFALLLFLEPLLSIVVREFDRASRRLSSPATRLAAIELRAPVTYTRSLAIAATGAIAVFGSVAIQGAHRNLQRGLDRTAAEMNRTTDLWVSPSGVANTLGTTAFTPSDAAKLAKLPAVRSLAIYRGGFLDIGSRRVWVIAPPRSSPRLIPPSQLARGNLRLANERLRAGGWVVVSQAIADEHHLRIGQVLRLPSPIPTSLRIAALSTNVGWPPGAVFINSGDYARAWGSSQASAYNISLKPGVSAADGRRAVQRSLGSGSGLDVQTAAQREAEWRASSRQGLSRLSQIALLVLVAAVLAMAGAIAAMIWQRRPHLAYLKRQGYRRAVLWRALLYESALLLAASCTIGAVFGLYGQLLLTHALASVTGFPVVFSVGVPVALWSIALVSLAAASIVAIPGYLAARVTPSVNPG
ncbi:MAG TPA: ABC transporter permease, partial [Solirubrobacteraceae bacterium]|nr:ABC transporter permease [Solirubrobacteraceae bacterium]